MGNEKRTTIWEVVKAGGLPLGEVGLYVLAAGDGHRDHCVAVVECWIFDANFGYALPLSKESLDRCCSTVDKKSVFVGAVEWTVFCKCHLLD